MLFFNQSSSLFHKFPLSPFYLQWSRTALGTMRQEQCCLQHAHSFTDTEFSLAKTISTHSCPPNPFFSVPNPSNTVLPPPSVKGPPPKLIQIPTSAKGLTGLASWINSTSFSANSKADIRRAAGSWKGEQLSPCTGSLLDLLKMWLQPSPFSPAPLPALGSDPSFALAQALVPCHSAGGTMQGAEPAEGYWALPTTCQKAIFSQPSSRTSSDQKANQYKQ